MIQENGLQVDESPFIEPSSIVLNYDILRSLNIYKRAPVSLLSGLSRIGGLFFFFSLGGSFFYVIHLYIFQRSVSRNLIGSFKRALPKSDRINTTTLTNEDVSGLQQETFDSCFSFEKMMESIKTQDDMMRRL